MKRHKKYKLVIFLNVFILTTIMMLVFGIYTYCKGKTQYLDKMSKKVEHSVERLVLQVDERFENLKQYYVAQANNESIKWFLENNMQYSDYSNYKLLYEDISSDGIFIDYWKSIALINFKTDWVVCNKGVYSLEDAYNKDAITEIFDQKTSDIEWNYWIYDRLADNNTDKVDREYRLTVETGGLDFVMRLPATSSEPYALFIANIDMDTWKEWISELLESDEEIVVLDSDGEAVYYTSENLIEGCKTYLNNSIISGRIESDNNKYIASSKESNILGWNYYVIYDMSNDNKVFLSEILMLVILSIWGIGGALLISSIIYSPVNHLVKKVTGGISPEKVKGKSELDYIENMINDQQGKLLELFEIRLVRGEIHSDELNEYIERFQLKQYKYYETAVIILKLGDDEIQSNVNEDAQCLKLVQDMPIELSQMVWMPPIFYASTIFAIIAADDEEELNNKIQSFYEKMKEYVEQSCQHSILMGVSSTHENYSHIRAAYRESIEGLTSRKDNECNFYLAKISEHDNSYNTSFEQNIKTALNNLDKQECYRIIDEFDKYLTDKVSYDMIPLYTARMVDMILLTALNTHVNLDNIYPEGVTKLYHELISVNEHSRICRYLKNKLIDPIIAERKKLLESNAHVIMEQIEKQIADSKGNITVTECADMLGISTSYIWKVLKMENGKSFSEYQDEYKLEEAKRLLLETDLSVIEIATRLNYTNAQNFIRFFNKKMGVTPGKYRKL